MVVAVISTKVPILVGHDVGPFHLTADIKRVGFWSAQHEARADLTMFLGLLFLLIVGAGALVARCAPIASRCPTEFVRALAMSSVLSISSNTSGETTESTASGSLGEVFRVFLKLGLTSFGGPIGHLGYFRE